LRFFARVFVLKGGDFTAVDHNEKSLRDRE
jgi:hypothetical protein